MFSPIIKWAALKTIIVFITIENLKLILADIFNIFLNGKIDYKVYIDMLEGFNQAVYNNNEKRILFTLSYMWSTDYNTELSEAEK